MKDKSMITPNGIVFDNALYNNDDWVYCTLETLVTEPDGKVCYNNLTARRNSLGNVYLLSKSSESVWGGYLHRECYSLVLITSFDELYKVFENTWNVARHISLRKDPNQANKDSFLFSYLDISNNLINSNTLPNKEVLQKSALYNMQGSVRRDTINIYRGDPYDGTDQLWYAYYKIGSSQK